MLEGGYSDHPCDTGGKTKYGITEATARKHGYKGEMRELSLSLAKDIYKKDYWNVNRLDEIKDPDIQGELFDTGVNCGTKTALKFIQKAYNLLVEGNFLAVDGIIGQATIRALNSYSKPERIVGTANAYQAKYYLEITEGNAKNKAFIWGWLNKRVKI